MHEALCRPSGTTLDIRMSRDGPPITQRTSGLERIQPFEKLRHKVEQIRAGLQKGTGILKIARLVGTGVSALQRIKATMKQTV